MSPIPNMQACNLYLIKDEPWPPGRKIIEEVQGGVCGHHMNGHMLSNAIFQVLPADLSSRQVPTPLHWMGCPLLLTSIPESMRLITCHWNNVESVVLSPTQEWMSPGRVTAPYKLHSQRSPLSSHPLLLRHTHVANHREQVPSQLSLLRVTLTSLTVLYGS
jgi:hypothetical protein